MLPTNFAYSANYWFVPDTLAPDGTSSTPTSSASPCRCSPPTGSVSPLPTGSDDNDDKLVVIPAGATVPDDDTIAIAVFELERCGGRSGLIVRHCW